MGPELCELKVHTAPVLFINRKVHTAPVLFINRGVVELWIRKPIDVAGVKPHKARDVIIEIHNHGENLLDMLESKSSTMIELPYAWKNHCEMKLSMSGHLYNDAIETIL